MSTRPEQIDDADDARLAWLLTSTYSAPEMRGEFASALAAKLDAEFAAGDSTPRLEQALAPSRNGHAANGRVAAVSHDVRADVVARRTPRWRRWSIGVAAAAALLVAMAVWSDPPAWGNVIRAGVGTVHEF